MFNFNTEVNAKKQLVYVSWINTLSEVVGLMLTISSDDRGQEMNEHAPQRSVSTFWAKKMANMTEKPTHTHTHMRG